MEALAKYLPIEGEIREGELYFNEHSHLTAYAGTSKPDDKCKKADLFAVTQDIKVGDEVWDLFKGVKHGIAEELYKDYIKLKDVSYDMDRRSGGAVKVLGLLSPNATWVKDGEKIKVNVGWDKWEGPNGKEPVICQVLGPCGHYH